MTEDLTTETEPLLDLDELEHLANAARPAAGRWSATQLLPEDRTYEHQAQVMRDEGGPGYAFVASDVSADDAKHIAAMDPTTTLELIAEVRKGREASSHFDTLMGFMVQLAEVAGAQPPSSLVDGVEDLVDETITKMVTGS